MSGLKDLAVVKISSQLCQTADLSNYNTALVNLTSEVIAAKRNGSSVVIVAGRIHPPQSETRLLHNPSRPVVSPASNPQERNLYANMVLAFGQVSVLLTVHACASPQGFFAIPLHVTRSDWADQRRYERVRDLVRFIATTNGLPIVFPNEVFTEGNEFDWDHDQLACLIAVALQAERAVFVCGGNELVDDSRKVDYSKLGVVEDVSTVFTSQEPSIASKLEAARLLSGFGIPMHLCSTVSREIIAGSLTNNEKTSTKFTPQGRRLRQTKSWIALAAASRGGLVVSTFLADSLREGRAVSILAIGIESVQGSFREGDIVTVRDTAGSILGRGRARFGSEQLGSLVGGLRDSVRARSADSEIVIHYDYFALNPSLRSR